MRQHTQSINKYMQIKIVTHSKFSTSTHHYKRKRKRKRNH